MLQKLGRDLWELNLDLKRAIRIWEQIVHPTIVANKHDTALATARRLASAELGMVEFSQALAAHRAGTGCAPFVAAMERLAAERGATTTTYRSPALDDPYGSDGAALVLAAFYRIQGRLEEARARLRSRVIRALDGLTDDDEENDAEGFAQLSDTLYRFGDDVNAAAAWHLCCIAYAARWAKDQPGSAPPPAAAVHDRTPAPAPAEEIEYSKAVWELLVSFTFFGFCDGPCGIKQGPDSGNHKCRYCADYAFCDACFRLLQTRQMPYRLCDRSHDFYTRTFPLRSLPAGMVCVGEQVRPMAEWLAELRTAWTVAG
ncbi:MAG: hypothetical protein M1826_003633 [Phylliscum demangeonii]|nr:MAG: hypothetical protein M1826_003633 [Phylliscum demangeonii]